LLLVLLNVMAQVDVLGHLVTTRQLW